MAVEVGLAFGRSPSVVYKTWYPCVLASVYAYIMNKKYKEGYSQLTTKDKKRHPAILVEQVLGEDAKDKYVEQSRNSFEKLIPNGKHR